MKQLQIKTAIAALGQALNLCDEADLIKVQPASDPSGEDDMIALAESDKASRLTAAEGRVCDAMTALKDAFPGAWSRLHTAPPPVAHTDPPPVVVEQPEPPTAEQPAEGAVVAEQPVEAVEAQPVEQPPA